MPADAAPRAGEHSRGPSPPRPRSSRRAPCQPRRTGAIPGDLGHADGLATCDEGHHHAARSSLPRAGRRPQRHRRSASSTCSADELLALDHPSGQREVVEHVAPVVPAAYSGGHDAKVLDLALVRPVDRDDAQVRAGRLLQVPRQQLRDTWPGRASPTHPATGASAATGRGSKRAGARGSPRAGTAQRHRDGRVHEAHDEALEGSAPGCPGGEDGHDGDAQRDGPAADREPPEGRRPQVRQREQERARTAPPSRSAADGTSNTCPTMVVNSTITIATREPGGATGTDAGLRPRHPDGAADEQERL